MLHIYTSGHRNSLKVCRAFAAGTGFPIVSPDKLYPGAVFSYGNLRGLMPILRRAQAEGRDWYFCDNAYFGRGKYFRVTKNAWQHDGSGNAGPERWKRLGIALSPWRTKGRHVVVCPPSLLYAALQGFDADEWLDRAIAALRPSGRKIVIRRAMTWAEVKDDALPPLSDHLAGAWALVTHSSNAAVEAVVAGVPVFCTGQCAASVMGLSDLSRINEPVRPERETWCWNLAAAQWTLREMSDGTCWRELQCTA